ncbi:MAG: hypothetical protein KDB61_06265, partial [Planctomycetes bacterium]|nr:hypothetical protein [Planctomycetota bacterium]
MHWTPVVGNSPESPPTETTNQEYPMLFSLRAFLLPATLALVPMVSTADASPEKLDWGIEIHRGGVAVHVGTRGYPRPVDRRRSRPI